MKQGWKALVFLNSFLPLSSDQIRSDQYATPWISARQASLSITNFRSSLRLMSIQSVMPSSHLILCRPLLLLPPPPASESFPMSQLFAWDGQSTGVSALASFRPKKSQGWSPSGWNFRSWWWTGWPGVLQFIGSQRVRHDRETELNWTELKCPRGGLGSTGGFWLGFSHAV